MTQTMPEPVWRNATFWINNGTVHAEHDVRQSEADPALVAYYPNAEKKARDLRTRVKPGRYLSLFFADILSAAEIKYYATWQATQSEPDAIAVKADTLLFATTPDEIEQVYLTGPSSCMSYETRHYSSDVHPTRVYGAGDLAIAYLSEGDSVIARSLCWPEKKVFGRVYPTARDEAERLIQMRLHDALMSAGYESLAVKYNGFDGAKLLRIEDGCKVVMPYLDNSYQFEDMGGCLIMSRDGRDAGETNGLAPLEEEEPAGWCERCADSIQDEHDIRGPIYTHATGSGGRHGATWCSYCEGNYTFRCEGFEETFSDDVYNVEINGLTYTQAYASENFTYSDFSDAYFEGEAIEVDGETWSTDEFEENGFECAITGEKLPQSKAHADYPEIAADCDYEAISDWLTTGAINVDEQLALPMAA